MAIRQDRYVVADTNKIKKVDIIEVPQVPDDPFVRKSEIQQTVNNSTLPVSSRAVNLAINSIEIPSLDGYATEDYVDEGLESVNSRVDLIDEKATEAKAGADRAEQAVGDTVGSGKIMREGAYGVGSTLSSTLDQSKTGNFNSGFSAKIATTAAGGLPAKAFHHILTSKWNNNWASQIAMHVFNGRMYVRGSKSDGENFSDWNEVYSEVNTTVDSNGFIKEASPIIKLFNDRIEANNSFKGEPELKKIDTGVYQISGTLGLAKEGWYIETPRDRNGFPYFLVEWEQDENNVVTIRTFKRKIDLETLDFVNGDPVDIWEDQRWIDLRFHEEEADDEELHSQLNNLDESAH